MLDKSYNPLEVFMEPKGVGDEDHEWMWITLPIPNYVPQEGEEEFSLNPKLLDENYEI